MIQRFSDLGISITDFHCFFIFSFPEALFKEIICVTGNYWEWLCNNFLSNICLIKNADQSIEQSIFKIVRWPF